MHKCSSLAYRTAAVMKPSYPSSWVIIDATDLDQRICGRLQRAQHKAILCVHTNRLLSQWIPSLTDGSRLCDSRLGTTAYLKRHFTISHQVPTNDNNLRYWAIRTVVYIETTLSQEWSRNSIQGPQYAFELSMFMCPAVHKLTRNLLRSSSTHEPSDPPFRVVILVYKVLLRKIVLTIATERQTRNVVLPANSKTLETFRRVL